MYCILHTFTGPPDREEPRQRRRNLLASPSFVICCESKGNGHITLYPPMIHRSLVDSERNVDVTFFNVTSGHHVYQHCYASHNTRYYVSLQACVTEPLVSAAEELISIRKKIQ